MEWFYLYPLQDESWLNRLIYKLIIKYNDSWIIRMIKNRMINNSINKSRQIKAYQRLYNDLDKYSFKSLPIINKQIFHFRYPNIKDRVPHGTDISKLHIVKTSGSTSGKRAKIPLSNQDMLFIRNYYRLIGYLAKEIMPREYKYINMFPISNSSTGVLSEQIVPENFRLGRSNADPVRTYEIIDESLKNDNLNQNNFLVLGGLPILHLEFLSFLNQNVYDDVKDLLKQKGICLYGGESPNIEERLKLYQYYNKIIGIFGSTELGPKLGFSIDLNLIIDIALTIKSIRKKLCNNIGHIPISFFFDKYLHHYEIINNSLVITPIIQQSEIKLKWDQDDYCELIDHPKCIIKIFKEKYEKICNKLDEYDNKYKTSLKDIFHTFLNGKLYDNFIHYFGILLFYGRKGIIYGGANLDNSFVEIIFEKLKIKFKRINYLAINRSENINTDKKTDINMNINMDINMDMDVDNYSGLILNILVETQTKYSEEKLKKLKIKIIKLMKEQHHDLKAIWDYYESKDKLEQVLNKIHIIAYLDETSPMHIRFENSKKRVHIFKEITDNYYANI